MSFQNLPFLDVFRDATGGSIKTRQTEFLKEGEFPVVDQGQALVAGFVNDRSRVCRVNPPVIVFGDHTRVIKYVDFEFAMGADGTKVLVPKVESDTKYLYYALKAIEIPAAGYSRHYKFLKETQIPFPPLPDQRRIAQILDKADALQAKRRAALAQLDTLTQSIFLDMFGDPATNPNEMRKVPLGDLIKLKSGEFLPAKEMIDSGPYSVLGGNGISGFHDQYMFEDPQIVIGRVGVYCGCVHASPPKSWVTDNALYVSEWSPRLKFEYLLHAMTHARLNQYASQSGQPLVSGSRIYPVAILVPPEELQLAFEARIARTGKLKRLYEAANSKVDVLIAALQHRAFQGGL